MQEEMLTVDFSRWEMIRGKEFMKKQELIDAAEASGLSRKAIGPNNYKSKHGNSGSDFYTGWSCMTNLTDKDLVVKKSNPAKYYLTEKGKQTARICLAKSGLDDPAGPFMATGHPESVMLSDLDSDEQEGSSPLIGSENFSERSGLPNSKAGNSSSFPTNNGRATNSPLSSRGMFGQQSFSAMGSSENSLLAMPPRQYDESFLDTYEVVLILDDRDTFGARARRKVVDNIHTQFDVPVESQEKEASPTPSNLHYGSVQLLEAGSTKLKRSASFSRGVCGVRSAEGCRTGPKSHHHASTLL